MCVCYVLLLSILLVLMRISNYLDVQRSVFNGLPVLHDDYNC